jgi:hypothetical protein
MGFYGSSRTGKSLRFGIRHIEVRILSAPDSLARSASLPSKAPLEMQAFDAFDFVPRRASQCVGAAPLGVSALRDLQNFNNVS